ncbi:MAG: tetratricopeptide repeat protein [Betaproteobacteria bacterium]|nr:tetratricopeptide repeat protein [Betaproteobacteria bacterium]
MAALILVGAIGTVLYRAGAPSRGADRDSASAPPSAPATYLGASNCTQCHAKEFSAWQGSQHDRAMQPATDATMAGDFANAKFTYAGVTSTFFRRDGKFFVNTDGADGKLADFRISYTFGVEPLQQYLVDFPDGRKQALGIAWDARPKAAGGQRWFHLYPGQKVKAGERLHWTGIDQNWNYQCADCHSTNLRKNFDEKSNTFRTTWTDINVNCEACHGPGSNHVAWARKESDWKRFDAGKGLTVALDERRGMGWIPDAATGSAKRTRPRDSAREIEVCARCHSRRGQFTDAHMAGQPLTDAFRPALLESGLYHADGQMQDEVYNYASFLQSKMNAQGVTCSDCHDPHSQKLRAPGNGVCSQCHATAKFDSAAHHHHLPGSKGAECAACHMPTTTYMGVDPRHDHSMRIPRPDLSPKVGTPNACNGCHKDRKPAWAAAEMAKWFPDRKPGFQDFAEAFAGADRGEPAAIARLITIAANRAEPAIVRASAISRLGRHPGPAALPALRGALDDPDAMVRAAAVSALGGADEATRASVLARMLDDPVRLVRMEAARELAGTSVEKARLESATAEFVAEQTFNADRPESHLALGNLAAARGDFDGALAGYRKALAVDPGFIEAAINLADLYRARGDEKLAEETLRAALRRDPASAGAHHALGLVLVRQKRMPEAITELSRATTLAPADARFAYVYGVALFEGGRKADALRTLDAALARHPYDRDILFAAASYRAGTGDKAGALPYARRLQAVDADNPQVRQFVRTLEGGNPAAQ